MNKRILYFAFTILIGFKVLLSFVDTSLTQIEEYEMNSYLNDFSANPPTGKTGAPGESTCTDCHNGSILSAIGTITMSFSDVDDMYVPGQSYSIGLSIGSGAKNGFQMTILDGNLQKAGNFINGTNTSIALAGGREYIRHSASSGITNFQFQWTAPATEKGDLRAYFSFNKSNNGGSTSGDKIYVGSFEINSSVPVSVNEQEANAKSLKVFWDDINQVFHIDYRLLEPAKLMVNVQTLDGKLVQSTTLGLKDPGQYNEVLATNIRKKGLYIVSVFVDNTIYNQKMMLN